VDYGQAIESELHWLSPNQNEISSAETIIASIMYPQLYDTRIHFIPAHISQATSLHVSTYSFLQQAYSLAYTNASTLPPNAAVAHWLDLSQFKINPIIGGLLQDNFEQRYGGWEIALHPAPTQHFLSATTNLKQTLGSMFLTQPPCKALGVYLANSTSGHLRRLTNIQHATGITVGRFFSALEPRLHVVMEDWKNEVEKMTGKLCTTHWTAFTYAEQRRMFWDFRGLPSIVVFLEPMGSDVVPIARAAYSHSPGLGESECE
jgi:hypothetical protein